MEIRSVSNAAVNRPTASSVSEAGANNTASLDTTAGNASGDKKSASAVAGGYISPYINYDQGARVAVLLFRDVETGATQDQIPSRRVVEEYRRTASRLGASTEQSGRQGAKETGAGSAESAATGGGTPATGSANSGTTSSGPSAAALGVSFASFGASGGTSSAAASFASTSSAPPSGGGVGPSTAPVAISGGGGSPYSGGLVSVTV